MSEARSSRSHSDASSVAIASCTSLVGDCTLRARGEQPGTTELGYSLAPAWHRHGYATEAAGALCAWALALPTIARVVAITDARNRASIAVLERLGMARIAEVETKVRGELTRALWYQLTGAMRDARAASAQR